MSAFSFRGTLKLAYVMALLAIAMILVTGLPYYFLPHSERPHSAFHDALKPGGVWGHGLGVVGSAMILLLLLYSARKRRRFGLRFGRLNRWLDIHIFLGIIGPLLITLHTAMKFNGIVSISYFSMLLVALSGVFGRYIYMQIPRDPRGHALNLKDIEQRLETIEQTMARQFHNSPDILRAVKGFSRSVPTGEASGLGVITGSLWQDVTMGFRARRLRRTVKRKGGSSLVVDRIVALSKEQSLLQRRIARLDSMTRIFHNWHVFHRPFAYIMLVIMFVHIVVTVSFGYKWVF